MNRTYFHVASLLTSVFGLATFACGDVPLDESRVLAPRGILRGTALYTGPKPCSENGHIVGNLVIFVQDNKYPAELRSKAIANIGVIPGDRLFGSEPRSSGARVCPTGNVTASAPWIVSPLDAGSYKVQAFFDYSGHFQPLMSTRQIQEKGDVAGGYVDTEDALKHSGDPNYQPIFPSVIVGTESTGADGKPVYTMPEAGFVADNIPITVGSVIPFTRPYFHVAPESYSTPNVPVITMSQAHKIVAPAPGFANIDLVQGSFVSAKLNWGVPAEELAAATEPYTYNAQTGLYSGVFGFQMKAGEGLYSWKTNTPLAEAPTLLKEVAPTVAFSKLGDPAKPSAPVVIMKGITLYEDSIVGTSSAPSSPTPVSSLKTLVRPFALCLNPAKPSEKGVLVTPYFRASTNPANGDPEIDIFDKAALVTGSGVKDIVEGCLPVGRYAINVVYPNTGQAWTLPNETGSCAETEGTPAAATANSFGLPTCSAKPRPILGSQAVYLDVVAAKTPEEQAWCTAHPTPKDCLP